MPFILGASLAFVVCVTVGSVWRGHPWGDAIWRAVNWLLTLYGTVIVACLLVYVTANPIASIVAAPLLTAAVVLWRRRREAQRASMRCGKGLAPCIAG